jgi:hypothetical protein
VRTLSPHAEVRFRALSDQPGMWICSVWISNVILCESPIGEPVDVVEHVRAKIKGMSRRMQALLSKDGSGNQGV